MNSIKKRSGPEFRQQARPLENCPVCRGKGTVLGVFYEMPCAHCDGSGIVDAETGEQLPQVELVLQLRLRLNRANEQIRALQARESDFYSDVGHGPMGKRYHGD